MFEHPITRSCLFIICALGITACKIVITVPEGGQVVSADGTYGCSLGLPCEVGASTPDVTHSFTAIPDDGWVFTHWAKNLLNICGGQDGACTVDTTWAAGKPRQIQALTRPLTLHLSPVFVPEDIKPTILKLRITETVLESTRRGRLYRDLSHFGGGWPTWHCLMEPKGEQEPFTETWTLDPIEGQLLMDGEVAGVFNYGPPHSMFVADSEREEWSCKNGFLYSKDGQRISHRILGDSCGGTPIEDPFTIWEDTKYTIEASYHPNFRVAVDGRIIGRRIARWSLDNQKSVCDIIISFKGEWVRKTAGF